ncbi:MAG: hypothetical protein LC732_03700 [Acidobacteria bacterium]|nr:hypothetical protein [Acidobacteriota bacterium]
MHPRFLFFTASTAIFVSTFLLLDRSGLLPQLLLGAVSALFLFGFARTSSVPMHQVCFAVALATTGEVVLSIGWGLYSYQHALIPLYVPAGHGIFYLLATETAQQEVLRRHARVIVRWVFLAGCGVAAVTLILYGDVWGLLWWIAAATLLLRSKSGLLLASCVVYTQLLEWLGTALGNWRWAAEVPWLGLKSANPPSGVGVLYILLDVLTVIVVTALARRWWQIRETELPAPQTQEA